MYNSLNQIKRELELLKNRVNNLQKEQDLRENEINNLKKKQDLQENILNNLENRINFLQQFFVNYNSIINNNKGEENKYEYLEEKEINDDLMKIIKEDICLICLQNYNKRDKICELTGTHFFHAFCIKIWLEMKNNCPLCKKFISFEGI